MIEKRSVCFIAGAPFVVRLFTFVLVSAVGTFPPPRLALSAEKPRRRKISFAGGVVSVDSRKGVGGPDDYLFASVSFGGRETT